MFLERDVAENRACPCQAPVPQSGMREAAGYQAPASVAKQAATPPHPGASAVCKEASSAPGMFAQKSF